MKMVKFPKFISFFKFVHLHICVFSKAELNDRGEKRNPESHPFWAHVNAGKFNPTWKGLRQPLRTAHRKFASCCEWLYLFTVGFLTSAARTGNALSRHNGSRRVVHKRFTVKNRISVFEHQCLIGVAGDLFNWLAHAQVSVRIQMKFSLLTSTCFLLHQKR